MLVLGLILILLAVAVVAVVALGGGNDPTALEIGFIEASMSTFAVFLLGAATLLLLVFGASLVRSGTRRAGQRRKDSKELSRLNKKLGTQETKAPASERELADQQRRHPDDGTTTSTPTSGPGPGPTR